jgi:hypothetical protein
MYKSAMRLSLEITDEERRAARDSIKALDTFLRELENTRRQDKKLIMVLKQNSNVDSQSLFEIRHLLRKYQREVKDRYIQLILNFAGKRDDNFQVVSKGYIHSLQPLEKDTITRNMKAALQDSVQQLTEFAEEFIELFENFNDQEQVKNILRVNGDIDLITSSIENIIDNQIKPHFEKNVIKRKNAGEIKRSILKRSRLIKMME